MVEIGEADAMVSGTTRHFNQVMGQVSLVLDPAAGHVPFGVHMFVGQSKTIFVADTAVNERPDAEMLADIAEQTAAMAKRLGQEPRVAFLSYSNFGNPEGTIIDNLRGAVRLLDERGVSFEYEGEMSADVALNPEMAAIYPFSRLSAPANVLIMPGLHAANISAKLLKQLGGGRVIGPLLSGMSKPVQIVPMTSGATDLVTMAVLAASGVVL
jgi:malate dehydrogenase (oxaloacetate-decarboxylating)(NADP+)